MRRILICDSLEASGLDLLREAGCELHLMTAEERPRLLELVADFDAIVVRSATKVTAAVLRAGKNLKVVGRAGVGVDNVDVPVATELGILVVNAPTANLLSATEHTVALMLALARQIPAADQSMKRGEWDRKSFQGIELHGKRLGVVGFGRIGQGVAARARSFEMELVAFDPFLDPAMAARLGVELADLDELLATSDVVTVHTPFTPDTKNLISAERIAGMKPGAMLINCARGGIVDEGALLAALDEGRLSGAGVDVFVEEPPKDFRLAQHPKVVATPHIGAQTAEAQERIALETARMVIAALEGALPAGAVNLPFRPTAKGTEPMLRLAERLARLASLMLGGSLQSLSVGLWGLEEGLRPALTVAAIQGALSPFLGEGINYVNAEKVARERGLAVSSVVHHEAADYPSLLRITLTGASGQVELSGTLFGEREPRVVAVGGFPLEFRPEGMLLLATNLDVPGVVGKLGTVLGQSQVNIADIHLARLEGTPVRALAVLRLDHEPSEAVLATLAALPEVEKVRFVNMGT